jgi:hypothetical protein
VIVCAPAGDERATAGNGHGGSRDEGDKGGTGAGEGSSRPALGERMTRGWLQRPGLLSLGHVGCCGHNRLATAAQCGVGDSIMARER